MWARWLWGRWFGRAHEPGDGRSSPVFEANDGPTGFAFQEYTPEALLHALGRALAVFNDDASRRRMTELIRAARPDVVITASPVGRPSG